MTRIHRDPNFIAILQAKARWPLDENRLADGQRLGKLSVDIAKRDLWGTERTVKAEWIVWVCKNPDAVKFVQPSGIEIDSLLDAFRERKSTTIAISKRTAYLLVTSASVDNQIFA